MESITDRIQQRLLEKGLASSLASVRAGLGKDYIRDLLRNKKKSVSSHAVAKLATVLDVTETWLLTGQGENGVAQLAKSIRFGGIIETDAFRPPVPLRNDAEHTVPILADPRFPAASQLAFEIADSTMDKAKLLPGMWLLAVELSAWTERFGEPNDGKLVVVARSLAASFEQELTVRRLRVYRDRSEYCPESSAELPKVQVLPHSPKKGEKTSLELRAIALSATSILT